MVTFRRHRPRRRQLEPNAITLGPAQLRHKRRARVVVSVTASSSAGQTTTATVKAKLKR
jgi:hypothetical protein